VDLGGIVSAKLVASHTRISGAPVTAKRSLNIFDARKRILTGAASGLGDIGGSAFGLPFSGQRRPQTGSWGPTSQSGAVRFFDAAAPLVTASRQRRVVYRAARSRSGRGRRD